jgi:hypothetical protein
MLAPLACHLLLPTGYDRYSYNKDGYDRHGYDKYGESALLMLLMLSTNLLSGTTWPQHLSHSFNRNRSALSV